MKKSKIFSLAMASMMIVGLLSGCSSTKTGSTGTTTPGKAEVVKLTWSTWGNEGEIKRFQELTDQWNKDHANIQVTLIPIPNDGYEQKIMTQLAGGAAPDVFYSGDTTIVKLIENKSIAKLDDMLNGPASKSKPDEFAKGLYGANKSADGIYGMPVDCNPMLLYYNKKLLTEVGIKSPQAYFDEGKWNWDTFKEVTGKLRDAKKYGFILENWWGPSYSWIWANAGTVFDKDHNLVIDKDPKAKEALTYVASMIKGKNFTYAGSLPKGQGADTMFNSGQVGFVAAGRWLTPVFSANKALEWDFIPYPTNTGNKVEPEGIAVAYLVQNAKSKHPKEAFDFYTYFISKEGQTFRLQGNGNAVPSIAGIDNLVTDSKVPEHAQYLIDARNVGYSDPGVAYVAGLDKVVNDLFDLMFLGKANADKTIADIATQGNKKIADYKAGK